MRKLIMILAACAAVSAWSQKMDWQYGKPGKTVVTNETTTLAQAAARGGFAGTETITPNAVTFPGESWRSTQLSLNGLILFIDNEADIKLNPTDGLFLNFFTGVDWQIAGNTLTVRDVDNTVHWSFIRPSGTYTVAATSDLAAYTPTNAFVAYTNSVVPLYDYSNGTTTGVWFARGTNVYVIMVTQ